MEGWRKILTKRRIQWATSQPMVLIALFLFWTDLGIFTSDLKLIENHLRPSIMFLMYIFAKFDGRVEMKKELEYYYLLILE